MKKNTLKSLPKILNGSHSEQDLYQIFLGFKILSGLALDIKDGLTPLLANYVWWSSSPKLHILALNSVASVDSKLTQLVVIEFWGDQGLWEPSHFLDFSLWLWIFFF